MSWIEKLHLTYKNNTSRIGDRNDAVPLLPVCHTTQNAQVTVTLDSDGNFVRASLVPKSDAKTIIPATEEAAGRAGCKPACYPLCDKLQYLAADFLDFGGHVTSGFSKQPREPHKHYLQMLSDWCKSSFMHPKVCAVLKYVQRGRVVDDLVQAAILHLDGNGKFLEKAALDMADAPEIFKVLQGAGNQDDAFVRFAVEVPGDPQSALWSDRTIWNSWAGYYGSQKSRKGLCFVAGEELSLADQHPAKIRNSGDKAKLISSNDLSGFTFRGRFTTSDEACGIGFDVTHEAHSALRWLIARQGRRKGDQAVVAWAVSGADIPDPFANTFFLLAGGKEESVSLQPSYTAQEVGVALSRLAAGYSASLGPTSEVVVLGIDSATPGRMAIVFYRELTGSEFLERVMAWHGECRWIQNFGAGKVFVGAPSPHDIAEAAYGKRLDDKLCRATIERLLPCIVDGACVPRDIVAACVRRAGNRSGFKEKEQWEWEKVLGIACALYSHSNKERKYTMSLERDRNTRDYLYGRLLAVADSLELWALKLAQERRPTNAARMMQRFADHPCSTWRTIELALTPYRARLGGRAHKYLMATDEIMSMFTADEFSADSPLTGEFLLGYHAQRAAFWAEPENESEESNEAQEDGINKESTGQE